MATTPNSTSARRTSTRRATASTRRSTSAKRAASTRASNRAAAQRKRALAARKAAISRAENAKTPVDRGLDYAQRAVLIPVGVALEARDRVLGTVGELVTTYSDRQKTETQLRRFERRGTRASKNVEREVRRTRTRVERELRNRRRRVERTITRIDRRRNSTRKNVSTQVEAVSAQVENAVQTGITAGTELATRVQERVLNLA